MSRHCPWFGGTLTVSVVCYALFGWALPSEAQNTGASIAFTFNTPEPHAFQLALDEIELEWTGRDPSRAPLGAPTPLAGARVTLVDGTRAVFEVTTVRNVAELVARSIALEAVNPGTKACFVLYEPGERTAASRQVLTTRTALLLEDPADPTGALAEYVARDPQPVPGVPGAYVLEASDPLSAIQLAEALRLRAGVRSAYPVLNRQVFGR